MEVKDSGIVIVSRHELEEIDTCRVVNKAAAKALLDAGVMISPDELRSPENIAIDMGLMVVESGV